MKVSPKELDNFVPLVKAYKHSLSELVLTAGFVNLYSVAFANYTDKKMRKIKAKYFILFLFLSTKFYLREF